MWTDFAYNRQLSFNTISVVFFYSSVLMTTVCTVYQNIAINWSAGSFSGTSAEPLSNTIANRKVNSYFVIKLRKHQKTADYCLEENNPFFREKCSKVQLPLQYSDLLIPFCCLAICPSIVMCRMHALAISLLIS